MSLTAKKRCRRHPLLILLQLLLLLLQLLLSLSFTGFARFYRLICEK